MTNWRPGFPVRVPPGSRTCASAPQLVISESLLVEPGSNCADVDMKRLDEAEAKAGLDPDNSEQLKDVAAVAMTRLAWRDSPVEDWHSIRHRRIGNAEMMRANAATTRLVRDVMSKVHEPSAMLERVRHVLLDPHRRLPDGRPIIELAPSLLEFIRYQKHVVAYCARWEAVATDVGEAALLTLLAGRGATFNWNWWRSTGWPQLVDEFIRRLDDPQRCGNAWELHPRRRLGDPPGSITSQELRSALLAGPDRMDTTTADYCLRAGLSLRPQDCGLPPLRRRLLPAGYLNLVDVYACRPPDPDESQL